MLAWTGGALTLLGVVLLMVLAAARGWFAPELRVLAGAGLGLALIAVGARLHRRPSAVAGALAVTATGFAALYLVLAAATALYRFVPEVPALGLAVLVAGAGLWVADRWRSQPLAVGVVVGATLLAPVVVWGWLLVALALALQVAALPVLVRRGWPVLVLVAAAGPVLYGTVVGALLHGDPLVVAVVVAALAVGLAGAVLVAAAVDVRVVAVLIAASGLPVLVTGPVLDGWPGAALVGVAALALAATSVLTRAHRPPRLTAATAATLAVFVAGLIALDGAAATTVVLVEAVLAAALAALTRLRFPAVVAMVFGLFGVATAVGAAAPPPVVFPAAPYVVAGVVRPDALFTAAGIATVVLALAVTLLLACGRIGWITPDARTARLWAPIGLVGLYGAGTAVVTLALLVAPDRTGFTVGHAVVTVSWTIAALVLLARGIRRPALRVTGLVLVAAAVAKLVLFDLVALDGVARVAAFLGAGLLLLVAGTRYARLVAEAETGPAQVAAASRGSRP